MESIPSIGLNRMLVAVFCFIYCGYIMTKAKFMPTLNQSKLNSYLAVGKSNARATCTPNASNECKKCCLAPN